MGNCDIFKAIIWPHNVSNRQTTNWFSQFCVKVTMKQYGTDLYTLRFVECKTPSHLVYLCFIFELYYCEITAFIQVHSHIVCKVNRNLGRHKLHAFSTTLLTLAQMSAKMWLVYFWGKESKLIISLAQFSSEVNEYFGIGIMKARVSQAVPGRIPLQNNCQYLLQLFTIVFAKST